MLCLFLHEVEAISANNPACFTLAQLINFGISQSPRTVSQIRIWDPQNDFHLIPWIGLLVDMPIFSTRKPVFPEHFRNFSEEGFWDPPIVFRRRKTRLICWAAKSHVVRSSCSCRKPIWCLEHRFYSISAEQGCSHGLT